MTDDLEQEEKAAIARAAQANAELMTRIGQPAADPTSVLSLLGTGEEQVLVDVPREFLYRPDHHRLVVIKAGTQPIPASLVDHSWFRGHGVTVNQTVQSVTVGAAFAPGAPANPTTTSSDADSAASTGAESVAAPLKSPKKAAA